VGEKKEPAASRAEGKSWHWLPDESVQISEGEDQYFPHRRIHSMQQTESEEGNVGRIQAVGEHDQEVVGARQIGTGNSYGKREGERKRQWADQHNLLDAFDLFTLTHAQIYRFRRRGDDTSIGKEGPCGGGDLYRKKSQTANRTGPAIWEPPSKSGQKGNRSASENHYWKEDQTKTLEARST